MSSKIKKPSKKTLRNKADKLIQEYVRKQYQLCLVCESRVTVGHHFITKKNSNALRYYLPNIIPLCQKCHCLVHCQPHLVEPRIVLTMGAEWYDDLMEVKRQGVKENADWYKINIEVLELKLEELK